MIRQLLITVLLVASLCACALPPEKPVTREKLMETKIYQKYIIEESPEQVLHLLNTYGEAVLEAKRNVPGKDFLVHVKLLATAEGVDVMDYDR